MKMMKYVSMLLVMVAMSVSFAGCSDDDEETVLNSAQRIEGDYVGTLKPMGYTDEPARAYVTLTRRANDAVSFKCTCETFDVDPDPVILNIEERNGGVMYLTSESSYSIEGTCTQNSLSITFSLGGTEWFFSGTKE